MTACATSRRANSACDRAIVGLVRILLRNAEKIGFPRYESLVAEYLEYPVPEYVPREGGIDQLPAPRRNNVINAIIGVRRCGKMRLSSSTLVALAEEDEVATDAGTVRIVPAWRWLLEK